MHKDVVFVSLPMFNANRKSLHVPYLTMSAYLEKYGISTEIIDLKGKQTVHLRTTLSEEETRVMNQKVIEKLREYRPLIIAISCTSAEIKSFLDFAAEVKAYPDLKETKILAGGVHPTIVTEDIINDQSLVDFAIIGEGEIPLLKLVQALKDGTDYHHLKGLFYFSNGSVVNNGPAEIVMNLDDIPQINYSKMDMDFFLRPDTDKIRPLYLSSVRVLASRGCVARCNFCPTPWFTLKSGKKIGSVRLRSPKLVVDEIDHLVKTYNVDGIYMMDDTFTWNRQWTIEFCQEIIKRDICGQFIWGCETRVNCVDPELLNIMYQAGCIQIDFGVEGGNQKILTAVKKGITVEQVRRAFRLCKEANIRTLANFMFNNPDETEEDVHATLALAEEIDADLTSFGILTPYPGTEIYDQLGIKLTPDEFYKWSKGVEILMDDRFKLAKHNLDLGKLHEESSRRFNPFSKTLKAYTHSKYLQQIFRSKHKREYMHELRVPLRKVLDRCMGSIPIIGHSPATA